MSLSLINENLLFQSSPLVIKIPTPQKILIIFNPISSAGNTEATALGLAEELIRQDKTVEVITSEKKTIGDFSFDTLLQRNIAFASHCFGCTAGAGSSCGGATAV